MDNAFNTNDTTKQTLKLPEVGVGVMSAGAFAAFRATTKRSVGSRNSSRTSAGDIRLCLF